MITREIINKNIRFHDVRFVEGNSPKINSYDYEYLCRQIDRYKNILTQAGVKQNYSIVIGEYVSLNQTAMVFACGELGLSVTIIDNPNRNFLNTKLKLLLPVHYLLTEEELYTYENPKTKVLMEVVNKTIIGELYDQDNSINNILLCKPDTVFLKCTSSGTTGTPKLITHTHNFMHDLVERNSNMFFGGAGMIANLNHGSSFATYFLPCLASNKVTDFYHISNVIEKADTKKLVETLSYLKQKDIFINHIMFPYTQFVDDFLKYKTDNKETILYTLGFINSAWINFIGSNVKDIISIFGSNETSGPTLINQGSDIDFNSKMYKTIDSFYDLTLNSKNELVVYIKQYDKIVETGDIFELINSKYNFIKRDFIPRINDLEVDVQKYNIWLNKKCKGEIVVDVYKNQIYLVLWENTNPAIIDEFIQLLRVDSNGLHTIQHYAILDKNDFYTGVKLDHQLIRDYFRQIM